MRTTFIANQAFLAGSWYTVNYLEKYTDRELGTLSNDKNETFEIPSDEDNRLESLRSYDVLDTEE